MSSPAVATANRGRRCQPARLSRLTRWLGPISLTGLTSLTGLLGAATPGLLQAQPAAPGLAAPGYTGLGMTPAATPAAWGQVLIGHDTALPGHTAAPQGHNFLLAVGLLPGLEVAGRLATNDLQCNMYAVGSHPCQGPVQRDLSASVKLGHRFTLTAWPGIGLSAAAGATDLGGAATTYRSYYGLVGIDRGPWTLNLGAARGVSSLAALNGGFGSLAWRGSDWLQLQAERIGPRGWVGGKLMLPAAWRPDGVEPWLAFQRSLQDDAFTPRQWWSVGVSVQLDRPTRRESAAAAAGAAPAEPALPPARPSAALSAQEATAWARGLARRLARAGFEDISIGRAGSAGPVVVEAENSGYAWNDLDALGVAMGQIARMADSAPAEIDLRLMRRGIVVWRVEGSVRCIALWLRSAQAGCTAADAPRLRAGALARPGREQTPEWWVRNERASLLRPRLLIAPDIDSRVGTEYGTLDSSWGVDLILQVPLWRGAHADLAYVQALGRSADYDPGQAFSDFRIDSQTYRAMLYQALDLGPGLAASVAAGRLFQKLDGGSVAVRWQPGTGKHRLGIDLSNFSHVDLDFHKRSRLASYRYFLAPVQTSLELQGGQFWHGDRGALAATRHWFGDVSVALFLRRSRFPAGSPKLYSPYGNAYVNAAGIEFSFPLTPRREHVGGLLQLRGADRFGYGVQTVVGQKSSNNLTPWFGRFAPVPAGLGATVDNFDRNSQAYLDSNLKRVREGWRQLPVDEPPVAEAPP